MKLMKMSVTVWYDCRPEIDCVLYEDELSADGKAYQNRDDHNEKKCVELGKTWVEYNGNGKKPFWRSVCIVENNGDAESYLSKASELYEEAIKITKWDSVSFIKNVEGLKKPDDDEIRECIEEQIFSDINGRKIVPLTEFKGSVEAASLQFGSQMVGEQRMKDYIEFFKSTLTNEIFLLLMKKLPLKIKGDMVEFENESAMNNSIEIIARKLSSDSAMRYLEINK